MLWWDDGFSRKGSRVEIKPINGLIHEQECDENSTVSCYRSAGAVPIPRKLSQTSVRRKLSAPAPGGAAPTATPTRKISCPAPTTATFKGADRNYSTKCKPIVELQLLKAQQEIITELEEEVLTDITAGTKPNSAKPSILTEPAAQLLSAKVLRPKILTGKTVTQEPDVKKELKRGSMKEKWGLNLSYSLDKDRLQIAVSKVSMFSPAAKAGISPGNTILVINDWQIEAMDQPQVAMGILLAAGYSVNLAWRKSQEDVTSWTSLDVF